LRAEYEAAGIAEDPPRAERPTADYYLRQGTDPEGLAAELDTPARRRAYIADFYGHRLWAAPGAFGPDDVAHMTEPFAEAARIRASWGAYEHACGTKPMKQRPRLFEPNPIPTLVLYGPLDAVVFDTFVDRCAVAFPNCVGPFVVPGAGHFLQWERAELFNRTLAAYFADRLAARP
jgi:pimeloyl-ACP methyl ester carboxylesterase